MVYQTLLAQGIRIPEDIAVIGYDNMVGIGELFLPPLSTVQLPHYEVVASVLCILLTVKPIGKPRALKVHFNAEFHYASMMTTAFSPVAVISRLRRRSTSLSGKNGTICHTLFMILPSGQLARNRLFYLP